MPPKVVKLSRREIEALVARDVGLPAEVTDEMAIPTHTHANPLIRWLFWRRYEEILRLAELDRDKAVLEFGCGIGIYLPTLCAAAGRVYAIDLFPQYAEELAGRRRLAVDFVTSLDEIDDGTLDLVTAADVLEHIENLDEYLEKFSRLLRPGGRLVISGPTENFVYKLGRWIAGFGDKGDYHVTNIDLLKAAITRYGFTLLRERRLPWALPPHLFKVVAFEWP